MGSWGNCEKNERGQEILHFYQQKYRLDFNIGKVPDLKCNPFGKQNIMD